MATLYLLHFDKPFVGSVRNTSAKKRGYAQHYLGWTNHLSLRVAHHQNGTGANLTKCAAEQGITFTVVRTWKNATREDERKLKKHKHNSRLCPLCNPNAGRRGKIK